jgi:redox-sensitive bicupin YhaK (pirin superfamily)
VTIHQDARVYAGLFSAEENAVHKLDSGRRAYVHIARGQVNVNGETLSPGNAAKISDEPETIGKLVHLGLRRTEPARREQVRKRARSAA